MARCNCSSRTCACVIVPGENVAIDGSGSASNPYVISATEGGGGGAAAPTGAIMLWSGIAPPTGWLICDGSAIDTATYPTLFGIIGRTFGNGNGTTTFGLPAMAGRVPVGVDPAHPRAGTGGALTRTLVLANLPQHAHNMEHTHGINHDHGASASGSSSHSHTINPPAATAGAGGSAHTHSIPTNTGADGNNRVRGSTGNGPSVDVGGGGHEHTVNIPAFSTANGGAHSHSINLPAFSGSSGGSSRVDTGTTPPGAPTAVAIEQPWIGLYYIIKT